MARRWLICTSTLVKNLWRCRAGDETFGIRKLPNPALEIARRYKLTDAKMHKVWSEKAQDTFMAAAPMSRQLAVDLLRFTAQRGGDAVRIKWTDFDGRGIFIVPEKTTRIGDDPEPNYHLCPAPLLRRLKLAQKTATAETILVSETGKPWSSSRTLSQAIRKTLIKCGLASKGKRTLCMHGLRHTAASQAATLGIGINGIMTLPATSRTGRGALRQAGRTVDHPRGRVPSLE